MILSDFPVILRLNVALSRSFAFAQDDKIKNRKVRPMVSPMVSQNKKTTGPVVFVVFPVVSRGF